MQSVNESIHVRLKYCFVLVTFILVVFEALAAVLAWQTGYFVHFVKLMWWLPQIFCVAPWATLLTADSVFDEDWAWHTLLRRHLWNYTLFIILYCCLGGFATGPMWQAETYVWFSATSLCWTLTDATGISIFLSGLFEVTSRV